MFFTYLPTALAAGIVQSFQISSPLGINGYGFGGVCKNNVFYLKGMCR